MHRSIQIPTTGAAAVMLAGLLACGGGSSSSPTSTPPSFTVTAYVSDQAGTATHTDANLVNAWGLAYGPTTDFWVANQGTKTSTVYNGLGVAPNPALVVTIPSATGIAAQGPTGVVYNGTASFMGDVFIFASLDGTLSGWTSGSAAVLRKDNSASGALYTGLATGSSGGNAYLYAADFALGTIDVFDTTYTAANLGASAFVDATLPSGYFPFNIQNLGGYLYVTYAQKSGTGQATAGAGLGYVDVYGLDGTFMTHLVSQGTLNAPWGMAIAPVGFGAFGGALLVGNFGDGRISAYNLTTGAALGQIANAAGTPLSIDGLWGMVFGNGSSAGSSVQLYFAAGPSGQAHGLFGTLSYGAPSGTGGGGTYTGGGGY